MQIRLHKRQMGTYIHGQRGWMDGASEVTHRRSDHRGIFWDIGSSLPAAPRRQLHFSDAVVVFVLSVTC